MKPTVITANLTVAIDLYGRAVKNPKILLLVGESGWGKTRTGKVLAERYGATYWECPPLPKSSSQYPFYSSLCKAFSAKPRSSTDALDILCSLIDRPLFIDQAHRLFLRRQQELPDIIQYLHEATEQPIVLAGLPDMEGLCGKYPQLLNRAQLSYFQPLNAQDVRDIAKGSEITIQSDLANQIHYFSKGNGWRVRLALEEVEEYALDQGLESIGAKQWKQGFLQDRRKIA